MAVSSSTQDVKPSRFTQQQTTQKTTAGKWGVSRKWVNTLLSHEALFVNVRQGQARTESGAEE